jgi:hypothetical protein
MKTICIVLLIVLFTTSVFSQSLFVPGGFSLSGVGASTTTGNVGIGTSAPSGKLEVVGGNSVFDSNYGLYIPSAGSSYFWKGVDAVDNVRLSVWDKFTFYNPTTVGLNTGNSNWNVQIGARDGSIAARGGAYFGIISGNIGLRTLSPSEILQIGNVNNACNFKLSIPGLYNFENVRLGQFGNGACGLEFINHADVNNSYGIRFFANIDNGINGLQIQTASSTASYSNLGYSTKMTICTNGNIGIGTINPSYLLDVLGTIRAKEVKVDLNGVADFVFDSNYKLRPLSEVEQYVKEHKHLQEIPSAKEVEQNGVSLGEMQNKLLQKVEELTLYVIELKKENELQKKDNEQLLQKITKLEKQLVK